MQLLEQYQHLSIKSIELMQVRRFDYVKEEFLCEGNIYTVYRSPIHHFSNAMEFYYNAITEVAMTFINQESRKDFVTSRIQTSLCWPIPPEAVIEQMREILDEVEHLVTLPEENEVVGALKMRDEWNDKAILAHFEEEFIFVEWWTSV